MVIKSQTANWLMDRQTTFDPLTCLEMNTCCREGIQLKVGEAWFLCIVMSLQKCLFKNVSRNVFSLSVSVSIIWHSTFIIQHDITSHHITCYEIKWRDITLNCTTLHRQKEKGKGHSWMTIDELQNDIKDNEKSESQITNVEWLSQGLDLEKDDPGPVMVNNSVNSNVS